MYIIAIVTAVYLKAICFLLRKRVIVASKRQILASFALFLVLAFTYLGAVSGALSANLGWTYFSLMSGDSFRYYQEAEMFSGYTPFVNEFTGEFGDYDRTPKFGLPSLLSLFNPLGLELPYEFYYTVTTFLIFICGLVNLILFEKVLSGYKIPDYVYLIAFLALFIFPSDIYWVARFLREGLANSFLLTALLSAFCYFRFGTRYMPVLTTALVFLFFLRPQLVLLALFFLFLCVLYFRRLDLKVILLTSLVVVATVFQIIQASGVELISSVLSLFGLRFLVSSVSGIEHDFIGQAIIWFLILWFVLLSAYKKNTHFLPFPKPKPVIIFSSIIILIFVMIAGGMQIRFVYPIFIMIKFLIVLYFIQRCGRAKDQVKFLS